MLMYRYGRIQINIMSSEPFSRRRETRDERREINVAHAKSEHICLIKSLVSFFDAGLDLIIISSSHQSVSEAFSFIGGWSVN